MPVTCSHGSTASGRVIPCARDTKVMRFAQAQGFNTADHFYTYLRDEFDALYTGRNPAGLDQPKMMSVGMRCR